MTNYDEKKLAYFAGVFDCKGSVYVNLDSYKRKPSMEMEVVMTELDLVKWMHQFIGVGTCREKSVKAGCKPQLRWRVRFNDAYEVAKLIKPYLKIKLDKVLKIINYYES